VLNIVQNSTLQELKQRKVFFPKVIFSPFFHMFKKQFIFHRMRSEMNKKKPGTTHHGLFLNKLNCFSLQTFPPSPSSNLSPVWLTNKYITKIFLFHSVHTRCIVESTRFYAFVHNYINMTHNFKGFFFHKLA
jgi:hypothetical protein